MLFKVCVIILAIGASAWADLVCIRRAGEECLVENLPSDFPETVEELLRDCNTLKEKLRCVITFYETNCPELDHRIKQGEELLNYVETECQEDSHNFQVISRNIDCATPAARSLSEACSWDTFSEEEFYNLIDLLQPLWDKRIFKCPSAVQKITCASHVISKRCGSELKDVVTNILQDTEWDYKECNEEHLKELLPFKEYLESLLIKQEMFEDTLSDEE